MKFTDYTADRVGTLFPNAAALRKAWAYPNSRHEVIERLRERWTEFDELANASNQPVAGAGEMIELVDSVLIKPFVIEQLHECLLSLTEADFSGHVSVSGYNEGRDD